MTLDGGYEATVFVELHVCGDDILKPLGCKSLPVVGILLFMLLAGSLE